MRTGQRFFKKLMVVMLTAVVMATMLPAFVMAAGKNYTSATLVKFNKKYTSAITESNKVDWYKIVLPSAGLITVRTEANICRYYYYFYEGESAEKRLSYGDGAVSWNSQTEWSNNTYQTRVTGGTYYFQVVKDSNYAYYGEYNITFSFEDAGESFTEKLGSTNNSFGAANTIALNKKYQGQICDNDNMDYFKFSLPSDASVTISASAYMTRCNLYVYDLYEYQLHHSEPWANGSTGYSRSDIKLQLNKGTYYFAVTRASTCEGIYNFTVSVDLSGWQHDSKGWWYRNSDGSYAAFEWKQIDGKWYYFDLAGYITTGWKQLGGRWYFFDTNGAMQTGWIAARGQWYYFDTNGVMQTGWVKLSGKWYYFDTNGAMLTGWLCDDGVWYFLKSDGSMAAKEYCNGYWFNVDGTWTYKPRASWRKSGSKWWYGDNAGWFAQSQTLKIDGRNYKFDSKGYCTNP